MFGVFVSVLWQSYSKLGVAGVILGGESMCCTHSCDPMRAQRALKQLASLWWATITRLASVSVADREVLEGDLCSIVRDKLLQEGLVPLDKLLLGEGAQRS